ncbi:MAG: SDR family oxidoreductase [Candidatus Hydrogenedentes bacterium]|jgi:NAD(P)-dependent dehydrogenase (short-subunit alcohol dehydrogenase family)|nr:SDR family oxidoreductase [Candidatus Hydrogenedentota bacterium]NLT60384.1 SDR family oxidoreductase [Candidatus Hydrogenedentota bacterium]
MQVADMFSLKGKVAVVAGGGGILGGAIGEGLAAAGANVVIGDLLPEMAEKAAKRITDAGGTALGVKMDAFDRSTIEGCRDAAYDTYGSVDILINAVGGNMKAATTSAEQSFFQLPPEALSKVFNLNILAGTIVPCQVFGERMKDNPEGGSIINISSMSALSPLTRIPGYSAAKAAVSNFTQWLAVHFAQEYTAKLRVNAIAPGFFLTEQNRFLMTDEKTGDLTPRGKKVIDHTPMGQFGTPEDLIGVTVWLASEASRFVTGIVVPIDGGFSAYSGV